MVYLVDVNLVRRLSPPANFLHVVRRLKEIRTELGQELFREVAEKQSIKKTRRQLEALQRDLKSVNTRAWSSLRRAYVAVLHEHPLFSVFAVDGRRLADISRGFEGYDLMVKTVDRAIADLQERRRGNPGKISDGSRQAARDLVELFCECRGVPRPRYDFFAEEVRNSEALEFAIACLKFWCVPGADELQPKDLIRSL